jgi:hypothetical protein
MKRIYVAMLLVMSFIPVLLSAQYKADSGYIFEVGFNPFATTNYINQTENYNYLHSQIINSQVITKKLVLKHIADNDVTRFGLNFDVFRYSSKYHESETKQNRNVIGFEIGREFHTEGTDRLSPYYGFIGGFEVKNVSTKNNDTETNNGWITYTDYDDYIDLNIIDRSSNSFYGKLLIGCDYYFAKNFYIGFEVNGGIDYTSYPAIKIEEVDEDYDKQDFVVERKASDFGISKSDYSTLKIGFKF